MFTKFHKDFLKVLLLVVLSIIGCRLTHNWFMVGIVILGAFFGLKGNRGFALVAYLLLPLIAVVNPVILPHTGVFNAVCRLGSIALTVAVVLAAAKDNGKQTLPFGMLFPFLAFATLSSMQGWFPMISFLKMVNFIIFLIGIYYGTRNLNNHPKDVYYLRIGFLAISAFIVWGSILTLLRPSVAYYISVSSAFAEGGVEYAEAAIQTLKMNQGMGLFCGTLNQSQALAPVLAATGGWVLCDMLLNEKRLDWLHLLLLAPVPILLFMTRSRIGFFSFGVLVMTGWFYCLRRAVLSNKTRQRLNQVLIGMIILLSIAMGIAEARNRTISRWLRKRDTVEEDTRSLGEALTASRQGTIELCMSEFRRSPLLGSGFQVIEGHKKMYQRGLITLFSAPVEKGLLPVMVLGETGVVGAVLFAIFLLSFYVACGNKRYVATITLVTTFLAANMAEATFFSPSGIGGILWVICVLGGFVIDMAGAVEREQRRIGRAPALMPIPNSYSIPNNWNAGAFN